MDMTLTLEELLAAFASYNRDIWPMQLVAYALGTGALSLAVWRPRFANRVIAGILAFFWLWTGLGFMIFYFGPVYVPAFAFGGLIVTQGGLLLIASAQKRLRFGLRRDGYSASGFILVGYALVGYLLVGQAIGHRYPESVAFGLTPCPVTVFTLGLLLLTDSPVPRYLLVIPLLWALGGVVPISLGVWEDLGLLIGGLIAVPLLIHRDRQDRLDVPAPSTTGPAATT